METIKKTAHRAGLYLAALGKWSFLAALIGGLCGVIGTAFHVSVDVVTEFRLTHPWVLWALPVLGLAIVGLYKLLRVEGKGTNHVLLSVQNGEPLPLALTPAIFLSTVLTHLGGGSVGREGAALQMGMAAFFTALFGTPLAATVFAIGVVSLGLFCHAALLPGLLADKGFLCVTIEEMFAVKGMELLPNTVYWDARSDEETLDPARK